MAINKVVYGTTTLVDLTDTTATADKILTGYGAYGRDGEWMDGSASAGARALSDVVTPLQGGGDLHTITAIDLSQDTVDARHLYTGYTAHDASGTAIVGTMSGGGGGATIEPLSVTQNGTYTAPAGVDGYSPVTVNVSGGGGNMELVAITMTKTSLGGQYTLALYSTTNGLSGLKDQYPPSTTTVYIPRYSSTQGLLALGSRGSTYAPYITGTSGTYTQLNSNNTSATYRVDIGGTFTVGASDIS